jgi:hypothetical protein
MFYQQTVVDTCKEMNDNNETNSKPISIAGKLHLSLINIKIVEVISFLKLKLLIIWVLVPILLSSQDTLISVSEKYGIFYVPYIGEWSPSSGSNDDFFVFEHQNSGALVKIKKEQVSVQSLQEFNQQMLQYINGLGRNQEFVELRKQFVPIKVLSQKGTHFLKVKSRQSGTSKFVLNPEVDKKMFHIEILENKSGNEPSDDVIRFISLLSLQPISGAEMASAKSKDKLRPQGQEKIPNEKDDLSSFKKVKSFPENIKPDKIPVDSQQDKEVTDKGTKDQGQGLPNPNDKVSGLPAENDKIDVNKDDNKIPTSDDSVSKTPETAFDPVISEEAAKIPDGDEMEPVINPVGTIKTVPIDAAWASGIAKNPNELLDALEGGRPGGDVSAMNALLRQSQGPFDEVEDRALMQKFAPYGISGSEKAHSAIRKQSEFLLQAMIQSQLMTQSAWEYDYAIAQNEIANLMKDDDEMEVTSMLAEVQYLMMQEQSSTIEQIVKKSEAEQQIPTVEELKAEDDQERKNAVEALDLKSEKKDPESLQMLGKWVKTGQHSTPNWQPRDKDDVLIISKDNINWKYKIINTEFNYTTKKYDTIVTVNLNMGISLKCPEFIPLYQRWNEKENKYVNQLEEVQFLADMKDMGSEIYPKVENFTEEVSVYLGIMPPDVYMEEVEAEYIDYWINTGPSRLSIFPLTWRILGYPLKGKFIDNWNDPNIVYRAKPQMVEQKSTSKIWQLRHSESDKTLHFVIATRIGWLSVDYKWESAEISQPNITPTAMTGDQIKDEAIAEHQANIVAAEKALKNINEELSKETDSKRREDLRLQALHMRQNVHDSKDMIESIKTETIVKTRGPWDEHAAIVLVETSRKLREEFQHASQMQASYVRMLNILKKYNPGEAEKFRQKMSGDVIKGIFDAGGFERAQIAIDALHAVTKGSAQAEQAKLQSQQSKADDYLKMVERHLSYVETVKSGCDKAIFVGTFFTGLAPGLVLSMAYEGSCTTAEKGPKQALKNMVVQGGIMLAMAGTMKLGSWGIGKLLNPKVAQSEVNTFKNILEKHRFDQEMEWNKALVNQLKEKVAAFEKSKAAGGKNYLEVRKALDDAVAAANSSTLAKRIMKNELTMLENQIKSGATRDYSKLKECLGYQKVFDNRLQKSIYPRADAEMISKLRSQGYNVEKSWFQEFRNACSRGVNADRDAGLIAAYEKMVMKNKQPVSMTQFMDEAQKAYDASYKAITGRSAKLADQSITSTAHNEAFPLSWLQKKMEGPISNLDPPVTPQDFQKAGSAIYNKVQNALKGSDPAFVKLQKACASLSKDLKSKVFERLQNPPNNITTSPESRKAALAYWKKVQQAMEDFATGNSDPLTTMKKLQQITGSNSIIQSAEDVQKLLNNLGGVK